jgi:hypothetical protein
MGRYKVKDMKKISIKYKTVQPDIGPIVRKAYIGRRLVAVISMSMTASHVYNISMLLPGLKDFNAMETEIKRYIQRRVDYWFESLELKDK